MPRLFAVLLTALSAGWLALILIAPFALPSASAHTSLPAAIVYSSAAGLCHQRPERSFHLAGTQLPVCARCFGLYASGALGAIAAWLPLRGRIAGSSRGVLLAAALPTALTWGLEYFGVQAFSNVSRAVAAVPLGAAAGWTAVRALRAESRGGKASGAEV